MSDLATARFIGRHLVDRVLPVFILGVARIPSAGLDFRPTPVNMSARELAYHVPQVTFLLTRAVRTGRLDAGDLRDLGPEPDEARAPQELVEYAEKALRSAEQIVHGLTAADAGRRIDPGPRDTGLGLLMLALEEAIHHRGQLSTYLRSMGAEPPGLD